MIDLHLFYFAGKAYMQMPLTTDHNAAAMFISTASPDAIPAQGTVFDEALQMSARAFNTMERSFKTVILISDGEDWDENTPKVLDDIARQGVMVCTVGIVLLNVHKYQILRRAIIKEMQ